MAFREVHASQFQSPTTPYTGCRHADGFFATESHSLHCLCEDKDDIIVTAGPLPPPQQQCVGHDQSGAWELFAFLDPSINIEEEKEMSVSEASESHRRASHSSIASMEASATSLPEIVELPTQEAEAPIAWLVLRSQEQLAPIFTAPLTYRPLTPLLTTPLDSRSEDETKVAAWVGSADDSKLRCYIADDGSRHVLREVELKDAVFSFDSPIMAMDSVSLGKRHLIAVGCQDGTVRVISVQYQRRGEILSFKKLTVHTVLVDGPIMALHLSRQETATHLVVGSMCGFVCRLKKTCEMSWQGPWMVAEGLWNAAFDSEDAVLAVNMLSEDMVALGTHSGKCFVWQQREEQVEDSYRLVWNCELPYSIHGLSHVKSGLSGRPSLLVTTRYTFHVFQRDVPKYCAATAKRRLEEMISERQTAVELLKLV